MSFYIFSYIYIYINVAVKPGIKVTVVLIYDVIGVNDQFAAQDDFYRIRLFHIRPPVFPFLGQVGVEQVLSRVVSCVENPFFVSRGYGGKAQDILVDIKKDKAEVVGDEPLLLAQRAPVVINADRYKAAQKAIENGADIIVMDDGFQNPVLYKDISFLVFDGEFGIGNGFGVPAGPMRESFSQGLKRAQAVIIIGEDKHNIATKLSALPVFYAKVVNEPINPQHKKAIAFAGIGRPQKFYNSLKQCGVEIVETIDFPDHHQYSKDELENLILRAKEKKAQLYTTTKDYVKIPQELRPHFNVLQIKIKWQDEKSLETFLKEKL